MAGAAARGADIEHREQPFAQLAHFLELDMTPRAPERLLEPLVVERLHEIVHGREVERLQRIPIVGRDEDRRRHVIRAHLTHDVEARLPRHLHVEKHEIRVERAHGLDRRGAVVHARDDLHVLLRAQQILHALAGKRLVVDDQDANRLAIGHG